MKTLRRLALLAAFALTAPAFAGPPPGHGIIAPPAPAVPGGTPTLSKTFTMDDLGELVKGQYKGAEATGQAVSVPKQAYKLKSGQAVEWSVQVGLMTRGSRPPVARIFFPCQKLPAKPNADRLAKLRNQNGGGEEGPAYFMVGGKDADYLYIVSEVTTEGLTGDGLKAEVNGLFAFADRTLPLWGEDLDTAPKGAKAEKSPLAGHWNVHESFYNAGSAPPTPFVAGLVFLYFDGDGTMSAGVQEGKKGEGKGIGSRKGTYTLKDGLLTLVFPDQTYELYTVTLKGDKLTLTPSLKNPPGSVTATEITLNKW